MLTDAEKLERFQKALDCGGRTHEVADVVAMIKDGRAQYWSNGDGTIVTELHKFPNLKAVHFWLVSGDLRHCLALEHDIVPWAIEEGCTVATASGRKGWGRALAPMGWRPWWQTFVKTLVRTH